MKALMMMMMMMMIMIGGDDIDDDDDDDECAVQRIECTPSPYLLRDFSRVIF